MTTTPTEQNLATAEPRLRAAAHAAVQALPAAANLTPGTAVPGSVTMTSGYAAAALSDIEGPMGGRMAVLVNADVLAALDDAAGGLNTPEAIQPAIDAVTNALGMSAAVAKETNPATVGTIVGHPFIFIPLTSGGATVAALLLSDSILATLNESAGAPGAVADGPTLTKPQQQVARMGDTVNIDNPRGADNVTAFAAPRTASVMGLERLNGVLMDVTVELGRTQMTVREILALQPGTVLELDRAAGSPADLLVNGLVIARGEVVVVDEDFGLRVTEVVADAEIA